MNIFLTSTSIPQSAFKQIVDISGKAKPLLGIVDIATKPYIEKVGGDPDWVLEQFGDLEKVGFKTKRYSFQSEDWLEKLEDEMNSLDVLYLSGGNSFVLNYFIIKTNLGKLIQDFIKLEKKILVGSSAGAIVLTKDMNPYSSVDNPEAATEKFYTGLGIFPNPVVVHWNNKKYHSEMVKIRDYYLQSPSEDIITIEDGQAVYFDGNKIKKG